MPAKLEGIALEAMRRQTLRLIADNHGNLFDMSAEAGLTEMGVFGRVKRLGLLKEFYQARDCAPPKQKYLRPTSENRPLWHMGEEGLE